MKIVNVEDPDKAAARAAAAIVEASKVAIGERGRFAFAVSGGRTPWKALELLVESELDWSRTAMFQVDERVAPSGSPERNLTHIVLTLPLQCQGSIRPMPVGAGDLDAASRQYAETLPERLDLVHLGLGTDGHTASLVPGDPVLEIDDQAVAVTAAEYQGTRRMTLTYPTIDRSREVIFLVTGGEKRDALERLLAGDPAIPAGRVKNERSTVITDIDLDGIKS